MQAGNNDIITHAWPVGKTSCTYESDRKDAEAENDQSPILISLAACVTTVAMNTSIVQLSREPMKKSYEKIYQYTMRDSWAGKNFEPLPSSIGQLTRSEINLLLVTIITCLHWSCVFSLFSQPRWKYKYLSNIITATLLTLLPLATITRDSTAVFFQFLPIVIDIYILATVIIDYAFERRPRFRGAT
ncbi:hypothetical protein H0G86_010871 [Trichoderma simmonsii]|uniref:Uncharacterized protein n=1 Tax=Trichoderma simmonsii TaxID=1491479 RepID=A0A8G0LKG5_9HYPO|nr:hypothetical protein H0G86_010871 [Trichoderma simmonsii]